MTDNELIAQFQNGITFDKDGFCTDPEQKYSWRPGVYDPLRVEHLQYHNNWNWLMPVVKKIEKVVRAHPETGNLLSPWTYWYGQFDGWVDTDIEVTYKAVVEFLQFHSKNV